MLAILGASGIRYITYRQELPVPSHAAARHLLKASYYNPPIVRFAILGAHDTSAVRARRRPLRGLEKIPTQRLNKKKRYPLSRIPFLFV